MFGQNKNIMALLGGVHCSVFNCKLAPDLLMIANPELSIPLTNITAPICLVVHHFS